MPGRCPDARNQWGIEVPGHVPGRRFFKGKFDRCLGIWESLQNALLGTLGAPKASSGNNRPPTDQRGDSLA